MSIVEDEVASYWNYLSVLRDYVSQQKVESEDLPVTQEFPDCLLAVNILINALIVFPAIQQVRTINGYSFSWYPLTTFFFLLQRQLFGNLLIPVITWNIFVCERILIFQLSLMYSLLLNELSLCSYASLIAGLTLLNGVHVMLIGDVIKLQYDCFQVPLYKTEECAVVPVDSAAGDGPSFEL